MKKSKKTTINPTLSANNQFDDIKEKIHIAINNRELEQSIEKWLKENRQTQNIKVRDLELLSGIITEYLDSYILFGYNMEGERVIIQNYKKAKDRDAMMEFLKIIFYKYQTDLND